MFALATTADVVTGATMVVPDDACLLAPSTLAYAIALPAMNRITPIITNMSVCFFTETFPLSTARQRAVTRHAPVAPLARVGGYDGKGATYIGPSDHSPNQGPW